MKVKELMTNKVEACELGDDLAAAAMIMWREDCGIVPVVDGTRRVQGVITDRDICIAVATRHRRPEEMTAGEVMNRRVSTIRPDEDVKKALDVLRTERIRRMPVVDAEGRLQGILSINDLILCAQATPSDGGVSAADVLTTLKGICSRNEAGAQAAAKQERSNKSHATVGA